MGTNPTIDNWGRKRQTTCGGRDLLGITPFLHSRFQQQQQQQLWACLDFGPAVGVAALNFVLSLLSISPPLPVPQEWSPPYLYKILFEAGSNKRKKVDDNVVDAAESVVEEGRKGGREGGSEVFLDGRSRIPTTHYSYPARRALS